LHQNWEKFELLIRLYLELVKEFIQAQKDSVLSQTVIDSLNVLREKTGPKFLPSDWKFYIEILSSLFDLTTPSFLNDYNLEIEEDNINSAEIKEKITNDNEKNEVCLSKCV